MGKNSDQGAYWREREAAWEKEYESQEADYGRHIRESYDRMIRWCDTQINDFYARYADREGVSIADAKERVSKADMEAYAKKAEQYCRDAAADRAKYGHTRSTASYFSDQANAEMRLYNLTMKVNRLEMLKANIGLETVRSFDELDMFFEEALNHRSMDELQHFSGLLGKYVTEPQKNARSIVDASFRGATFSDRIWRHQDALKFELAKELERGLIAGNSSTELARDIRKIFGTSQSNAERLLRTELCRVQIDSQQKAYEENGVEYFEFIGGQSGACDECSRLNGTVEKVEKMRPGLNAPPLHPNCRCSTAPYMDRKAFDEWLNGFNEENTYNKQGDPIYDIFGSICNSHPDVVSRIKEEARKLKVELRDGHGQMAYSPGLKSGVPGQLLLSEDDSVGAWVHEEQHMLDDAADGFPGFAGLFDIDRRSRMEYNAYKKEIQIARSADREDIANELIKLCKEEIEQIGGEWDEKQLE